MCEDLSAALAARQQRPLAQTKIRLHTHRSGQIVGMAIACGLFLITELRPWISQGIETKVDAICASRITLQECSAALGADAPLTKIAFGWNLQFFCCRCTTSKSRHHCCFGTAGALGRPSEPDPDPTGRSFGPTSTEGMVTESLFTLFAAISFCSARRFLLSPRDVTAAVLPNVVIASSSDDDADIPTLAGLLPSAEAVLQKSS